MSPGTLKLVSVKYVESAKGIFATFVNTSSNLHESHFFSFKPSFLVPLSVPFDFLSDFFGSDNVLKNPRSYSVFFQDFSSLKRAARILRLSFSLDVSVIEPERQFLVSRRWSYGDLFTFAGDSFERVSFSTFYSVADLFSWVCRLPFGHELNFSVAKNVFFENLFFGSDLPLPICFSTFSSVSKKNFLGSGFCEIDYSAFLAFVASLGNFSLRGSNCSCCAVSSFEADNLLKSSVVKARFLSDGFYFFPSSSLFSGKAVSGPFFRGKSYSMLAVDAFYLSNLGLVEVISPEVFLWGCKSSVSFFSFEVSRLVSALSSYSSSDFNSSFSSSNVVECLSLKYSASEFSSVVSSFLSLLPRVVFGLRSLCFYEAVHLECLSSQIGSDLASAFPLSFSRVFPLKASFLVRAKGNLSFLAERLGSSYKIQEGLLKFNFYNG